MKQLFYAIWRNIIHVNSGYVLRSFLGKIIPLLLLNISFFQGFSQTYTDNASNSAYSSGWSNNSNGGNGFQPWNLLAGQNSGWFIGNPSNNGIGTTGIGTTAFGLYATGSAYCNASREITGGMQIGDVFSFYWSINWDANSGGKGFDIKSGSTNVFTVVNNGNSSISANNGTIDANYGTNPMFVTITRTGSAQYSYTMTRRSDGSTYSTTFNSSNPVNGINFFIGNQNEGNGNRNMYFNAFQIQKPLHYRSKSSGNWSNSSVWESSSDGGVNWSNASSAPGSSAYGTITIQSPHTISQDQNYTAGSNNTIVVNSGATLNMTGATGDFQFASLTVNGTVVRNSFNYAYSGTLTINNGGKYVHAVNGGSLPAATWANESTLEVTGITTAINFTSGANQTFHHVVWNCASQGSVFSFGGLATINGNLTVQSTGSSPSASSSLLLTNSSSLTTTIGGNLTISGGFFAPFGAGTSGNCVLNISGNLSLSGGTLDVFRQSANSGTLNLNGDFSMSGGTLTKGGNGTANFNFSKSGTQTYAKTGGNITNTLNFTVNTGSTLNMGAHVLDGSSGSFTLSSGATLVTAHTGGITTSGASGAIQVSGTRTYSSGANYTYTGTTAQVTGNGLTSAANLTINSSSTVSQTNPNINLSGTLALSNGTFSIGNTNTLTISAGGLINRTAGGLANGSDGGTIIFNGAGSITGTIGFNNVEISGPVNFGAASTINGTFTIQTNGWVNTNAPFYGSNSLLVYSADNITYGRGLEWSTTSGAGYPNDVRISANTTIDFPNSLGSFTATIGLARDLTIDAGSSLYMDFGAGSSSGALRVGRHINIAGNLSMGDQPGGDIYIGGNWTRTAGNFTPNNRAVFITGVSGDQTISGPGSETFPFMILDKASGNVILSNDLMVTSTLTLTKGRILTGANTLTIGSSSATGSISGGSSDAYVAAFDNGSGTIGKLKRFVNSAANTAYAFPVGDATNYTPFTYTNVSGTAASGAFIEIYTKASKIPQLSSTFTNYLNRYWEVSPSGITNPNYFVTYQYVSSDIVGNASSFLPVRLSDQTWYHPTNSMFSAGIAEGSGSAGTNLLTWTGLTSFSQFSAVGDQASPLPIELLSFQATCVDENGIEVSWVTASEYNTSHFTIEKSIDGSFWYMLNQVEAAGFSTQLMNYNLLDNEKSSDIAYYRLTQYDNDGQFEQFHPISVDCSASGSNSMLTYPNPSTGAFFVSVQSTENRSNCQLIVSDPTGREVLTRSVDIEEGQNILVVDGLSVSPGIYSVKLVDNEAIIKRSRHFIR